MNPSQVRQCILDAHSLLRSELDGLEAELERRPSQLAALTAKARELLRQLIHHTRLEDRLLAPALRQIDAWGHIRAQMLLDHHEQQRSQLTRLLDVYGECDDPAEIARATLQLILDIRADMLHEEATLLSKALLRDDVVAVEMEAG